MTDSEVGPQMVLEASLSKPFGQRPFDSYILSRPQPTKQLLVLVSLTLFLLSVILWKKAPIGAFGRMETGQVEISVDFGGAQKVVVVPALVVRIKSEGGFIQKNYRPMKISVVSFVGNAQIPPGAEVKARLLSGATNGLIKARLTEPLKVDGVSVLDAGTVVIGEGRSSELRLFVNFNRAVFKDGKFIRISAQAYDLSDQILGLKGSRVGDYTMKLAASSGLYFLSGMAQGMRKQETLYPGQVVRPSVGDAALSGVSTAAGEQAKQYLEEMKNRAPIIEVKAGTEFILTIDGGNS
jgi:hypothetical protein